ncbi:MAG: polysaccharide biosynthesis protein, partial [Eubacteriales bacterium]|nr:polysaccharide biosynthesis protein [Eubacteriales bacterium]
MNSETNTENIQPEKHGIQHWQVISALLVVYDMIAVNGAYFGALWLRFDLQFSRIPEHYYYAWMRFTLVYTVFCIVLFWRMRLYNSVWRFASYTELIRVVMASVVSAVVHSVGITLWIQRMPMTYYVLGALIQFVLVISIRFSYRLILLLRDRRKVQPGGLPPKRVMLIGAGSAGRMILRELNTAKEVVEQVVCIIDDEPNKWHRFIDGVPVVGGRESILENVEKYQIEKIYLAIPSASALARRDILNICQETDCELKNLPGMYQLILDEVSVSAMKDVSVEDLLGREPIRADMQEVFSFIHGKTVLVTGGGGSIGSELCRQIAAHNPEHLIIFDIYENNAYAIQLELREKYPDLKLDVLIGSVRDSRRIFEVFETFRPNIVYHAAAHKHVPLMEDSPCEAIKNNAIGTYKTAYAAMVHGCERFVLISTDKAVNPTNIMGASKRLCEMIIQSFDQKIKDGKASEIPQLFTHEGIENADKDGSGRVFHDIRT